MEADGNPVQCAVTLELTQVWGGVLICHETSGDVSRPGRSRRGETCSLPDIGFRRWGPFVLLSLDWHWLAKRACPTEVE